MNVLWLVSTTQSRRPSSTIGRVTADAHTQTGGVVSFSGLGLARYLFPFPLVVYFICRPKSGYPQNLTTSIIGRREAAPAPAVPRDRRPKTFLLLNHTDNVGGKKRKENLLVSVSLLFFLSANTTHTHINMFEKHQLVLSFMADFELILPKTKTPPGYTSYYKDAFSFTCRFSWSLPTPSSRSPSSLESSRSKLSLESPSPSDCDENKTRN